MVEEKQLREQTINLLKRGYPVFPIKDIGKKLKVVKSIDVNINEEDIEKIMSTPDILFSKFREKTAGWSEFSAMYFLFPEIVLRAINENEEFKKYDYVVPIHCVMDKDKPGFILVIDCFKDVETNSE